MPALSIYCTLLFSESRLMLVTYRLKVGTPHPKKPQ